MSDGRHSAAAADRLCAAAWDQRVEIGAGPGSPKPTGTSPTSSVARGPRPARRAALAPARVRLDEPGPEDRVRACRAISARRVDCVLDEVLYVHGCRYVTALIVSAAGIVERRDYLCPRRAGADPFHQRPSRWDAVHPTAPFDVGER